MTSSTIIHRIRNTLLASTLSLALLGAFGAAAQAGDLGSGFSTIDDQAVPPRVAALEIAKEYGVPLRVLLRANHRVNNYVSFYIAAKKGNEIAAQNLALMPGWMEPAHLAWAQRLAETEWAAIQRENGTVAIAEARQ